MNKGKKKKRNWRWAGHCNAWRAPAAFSCPPSHAPLALTAAFASSRTPLSLPWPAPATWLLFPVCEVKQNKTNIQPIRCSSCCLWFQLLSVEPTFESLDHDLTLRLLVLSSQLLLSRFHATLLLVCVSFFFFFLNQTNSNFIHNHTNKGYFLSASSWCLFALNASSSPLLSIVRSCIANSLANSCTIFLKLRNPRTKRKHQTDS